MLLSPLAFAARSGGALITFALVMLDVSNKGKECASAHGFHGGVVVTICCSAHTDFDTKLRQECLISLARVLTAPVRMVQQANLWLPTSQGHVQSHRHQVLVLCSCRSPANDHAGKQIETHRKVAPS